MMASSWICALAVLAIIYNKDGLALKNVHVNTGQLQLVEEGKSIESVTFECHYDLEGGQLYAIKWYYRQSEFYRYVPHELPPKRVFHTQGVNVDLQGSDDHKLVLRNFSSPGVYVCEVATEAPLFETALVSTKIKAKSVKFTQYYVEEDVRSDAKDQTRN